MDDIPPLSLSTIFIGINATAAVNGKEVSSQPMGKGYYTVTFDDDTGLLSRIKNNYLNEEHSVENQFIYYAPSGGKYYDGLSPSGAYIFRPAQSNRYILGTNNNNKYKDIITTGLRFPATGFISNPSNGNPHDDAYNARVCNINTAKDEFSFMYMRTDTNGWGDTPGFDWIEFDTNTVYKRGPLRNKVFGTVAVKQSSTYNTAVTITFPKAFVNIPAVYASPRSSNCNSNAQYNVMITGITTTTAQVAIARVDSKTAWDEAIELDWLAYDTNSNSEIDFTGSQTILYLKT
eukprot:CAMPEP_0114650358 /NCGR_PEP_ID=MMETSP0191-20121206/7624_1 /TAXON_ID=126664 /ORGANISM="Sorites sp." /LENGTH=289 /DNA_ID=CAMNT_0001864213 /DNA_START=1573 /DNA_END=2443 /DNA_ORIENTATION=-